MVYFYHHSMQQPPAFPQHMEHFKPPMINMSQDLSQQVIRTKFLIYWNEFLINLFDLCCPFPFLL